MELVKLWRKRTAKLVRRAPREVSDGPVKENMIKQNDVDILKFPVPKWHRHDGGRYFGTGDAVITWDPEEHWTNLGVYRIQVHDGKTLGLHTAASHHGYMMMEKYWSKGKDAPVAVVVGQDPLTVLRCMHSAPLGLFRV